MPRIAIPQPTSTDLAYNQRALPQYVTAITRSGGEPVVIDTALSASEVRKLAESCDGVVLPGSPADVHTELYGQPRDPATALPDHPRDAVDYILLEDADRHKKPVLGICYGHQSLNVWRGGSLIQDLTPMPVNHEAGGKVAIAHTALVAPDSLLASMVDRTEAPLVDGFLRLPVNTSHHQAVATPGEGLRIVARCPDDGVVEAVENSEVPGSRFKVQEGGDVGGKMFHVEHSPHRTQFLVGVQWHPERSYEISPTSRALFDRLVAEAGDKVVSG
jgi:putative glutamine amidotransferase